MREAIAQAIRKTWGARTSWDELDDRHKRPWLKMADNVLATIKRENMENDDQKLVEDWRWVLLRSYSIRLAALASAGIGYALNHLDTIAGVIALAPPEVRAFIPIPVAIGIFLVVAGVRLWKQK